jgi:hypothetical protein
MMIQTNKPCYASEDGFLNTVNCLCGFGSSGFGAVVFAAHRYNGLSVSINTTSNNLQRPSWHVTNGHVGQHNNAVIRDTEVLQFHVHVSSRTACATGES